MLADGAQLVAIGGRTENGSREVGRLRNPSTLSARGRGRDGPVVSRNTTIRPLAALGDGGCLVQTAIHFAVKGVK